MAEFCGELLYSRLPRRVISQSEWQRELSSRIVARPAFEFGAVSRLTRSGHYGGLERLKCPNKLRDIGHAKLDLTSLQHQQQHHHHQLFFRCAPHWPRQSSYINVTDSFAHY